MYHVLYYPQLVFCNPLYSFEMFLWPGSHPRNWTHLGCQCFRWTEHIFVVSVLDELKTLNWGSGFVLAAKKLSLLTHPHFSSFLVRTSTPRAKSSPVWRRRWWGRRSSRIIFVQSKRSVRRRSCVWRSCRQTTSTSTDIFTSPVETTVRDSVRM